MHVAELAWSAESGWSGDDAPRDVASQLILVFGDRALLADGVAVRALRAAHPDAAMLGCSTAGEISGQRVSDGTVAATVASFERTTLRAAHADVASASSSEAGRAIGRQLTGEGLRHVFVLSDGLHVNGSDLVEGLGSSLPPGVSITGGLAGDGDRFGDTAVVLGEEVRSHRVAAVGIYGDAVRVGYGSLGGWDSFGPERIITSSDRNVLRELDGKPALALYKRYLGEQAADLPASALLYPLQVRADEEREPLVRTVLAVNEDEQSMTFAGDVPQGASAQLMKANFNRLIDGAAGAASAAYQPVGRGSEELAILISCVGRKLVLGQRVEEEVEAVGEVLGPDVPMTGFYSYGEISPFTPGARCDLHNQTMTITTLAEAA